MKNQKTPTAKFEKGQVVNYCGHEATITRAEYNVFSNEWEYSVRYYENGLRHGSSGVQEYWLNEIK